MKVLIIEDNRELIAFLRKGLQYENFLVDVAEDGDVGLEKARQSHFDIIIIDLLLPKKDGMEFLKEFRASNTNTAIIFLSAIQSQATKIQLLDLGADDYIEKPFSFNELMARVRAVIRRNTSGTPRRKDILRVGDLTLNPHTHMVTRNGSSMKLRRKEFALLEYLALHDGEVINPSTLLEHVWDFNSKVLSNTVGAHISSLRRKIDKGHKKKLIHTVHGVGYRFSSS